MLKSNIYNELDGYIGFWYENTIYIIYGDSYLSGHRKYWNNNQVIKYTNENCNTVKNYFEQLSFSEMKDRISTVHMNGRRYYITYETTANNPYLFETKSHLLYIPSLETVSLCKELSVFNNLTVDLANLICSQFTGKNALSWTNLFSYLQKCSSNEVDGKISCCTVIGKKIGTSLIKIAATRIFADPEQSILELPVNSMDSYFPDLRVGKFGMGFFSFLYWLIDHPKRKLHIYSWFEDTSSQIPRYCNYVSIIQENKGNLTMNLRILESYVKQTGTYIYMDTSDDPFDTYILSGFSSQIEKLKYVQNVELYFSPDSLPQKISDTRLFSSHNPFNDFRLKNESYPMNNKIFLSHNKSGIFIEDYAKGIPLNILLGSLFVPSISTKTIKNVVSISKWKSNNRAYDECNFIILVSNVMVVNLTGKCENNTYKGVKLKKGLIIDMPPNTRLPVSRDDIILDESNYKLFVDSILEILELGKTQRDVSNMEILCKEYYNYTTGDLNKRAINEALSIFTNANSHYLVTLQLFNNIHEIYKQCVISNSMSSELVEDNLLKILKFQKDIFEGKVVVTTNAKETTSSVDTFGMSNIVFVNENYQKKKEWSKYAAQAYPQFGLCPFGTKYGKEAMEKYRKEIPKNITNLKDENANNLYMSVLATFNGLSIYFSNINIMEKQFALKYVLMTSFADLPIESWRKISYALLAKMGSFKGNNTYGGTQYTIESDRIEFSGISKDHKPSLIEKLNELRTASIIFCIECSQEKQVASLWMLCSISPDVLFRRFKSLNLLNLHEMIFMNVNRLEDYTYACLLFLGAIHSDKWLYKNQTFQNEIKEFCLYILSKLKTLRISKADLKLLYTHLIGNVFGNDLVTLSSGIGITLQTEIKSWIEMVTKQVINIKIDIPNIETGKWIEFTTSQLISYLFSQEITNSNGDIEDIMDIFEKASKHQGKTKLQITEIAINEGTTKPFIPAVLTELTQNSADAIRMTSNKKVIQNVIYIAYADQKEEFIMQVRDNIGMSNKAFLYIGIPFVSTKTASELVTGEMGSGFFNVYRESSYVVIETELNNNHYISYDTPIIENGRVVDVLRRVKYNPNVIESGTSITVVCKNKTKEQRLDYLAQARYTSEKILSQISYFNNLLINANLYNFALTSSKELMFTIGYFDVYIINATSTFPSYLMTKGIPFAPLEKYYTSFGPDVQEMMLNNIIINIRQGGYTPVQTRTRINMPKNVKEQFEKVLVYAAFAKSLLKVSLDDDVRKWVYPNYDSKGNASSLTKYSSEYNIGMNPYLSLIFQFVNFDLFEVGRYTRDNITQYTNQLIKELGDDDPREAKIKKRLEKKVDTFNLSKYPFIQIRAATLLLEWISTKNIIECGAKKNEKRDKKNKKRKKEDSSSEESSDDDKEEIDQEITPYVEIFAKVFVEKAINSKIVGWTSQSLKIVEANSNGVSKGAAGYFSLSNKSLHIVTKLWSKEQRKEFVKAIYNIESEEQLSKLTSKESSRWHSNFAYIFPSSTTIHELEHARRAVAHSMSSHQSLNVSLWPDDIQTERTFDQCANAVFSKVISDGFYPELYLRYRKAKLIK